MRIETAAAKLAACNHPDNRVQRMRTEVDDRVVRLRRCLDCGAVIIDGMMLGWTRPTLIMDVCHAVRMAAEGAEVTAPLPDSFFEPTSDDERYSEARALVARIVEDAGPLLRERPITIRNLETLEHTINLAKSWLARRPPPEGT